jgi:hypothetical protein
MSGKFTQAVKLSLRLDAPVYFAIKDEATKEGLEAGEAIQRILTRHAINKELLSAESAEDYRLLWQLVDEAVQVAKKFCRDGDFSSDITLKTIEACMSKKDWAEGYERYVRDNPYKNGNPRKGPINKEIGFRIREGIGGRVKMVGGKAVKVAVNGSIIQSYTVMEQFDKSAFN